MTTRMPPEWDEHAATWMAFPVAAYPSAGVSDDEVFQAWSNVANLIVDHEPVHMLCRPEQKRIAARLLSEAVTLHDSSHNDAWLRDSGPTFIERNGHLCAVDWRFNGWGDHTTFDWQADHAVAAHIAQLVGAQISSSELVNEGGGIHVNGQGEVLLTDTVQLDPDRNPQWHRDQVENEIHQQLGTKRALWLPRGLFRDYQEHGTRGHVDIVACFCPDGRVLLHRQTDDSHPDAKLYDTLRVQFDGWGFPVVEVSAPQTLRDNRDWVDYSYINHYVLNGAVILPVFKDHNDAKALECLTECYPGRTIRSVDARVIFAMGGGVHCITQQQPNIEV